MKICSCLFSFWEKLSNNANVFWKIIFRISWSLLLTFLTFHWLLSDSYLTLIWIFACRFAWLFAARKVRLIEKKNTPKSLYKFVVYNRNPAAEPDNWISKENPHPKRVGSPPARKVPNPNPWRNLLRITGVATEFMSYNWIAKENPHPERAESPPARNHGERPRHAALEVAH